MTDPALAQLFTDRAQPSQALRYRQGIVMEFDPITLENVVDVGGALLSNLPFLGVGEYTTIRENSVVGILVIGDAGQAKNMAIIGRIVTPNTQDAFDATSLLGQQIFADIQPIRFTMNTPTFALNTYYTRPEGPRVTVPVGGSGKVLLLVSSQIGGTSPAVAANQVLSGVASWRCTGANNTDDATIFAGSDAPVQWTYSITTSSSWFNRMTGTQVVFLTNLTPGYTTFEMTYARRGTDTNNSNVEFDRRGLTVIRL